MKTYCFDIDGTICSKNNLEYEKAKPFKDVIKKINALYNEGNNIIFLTARGFVTGINWREVTENQLKKWKVKYHKLYFGKPDADIYIDDKAVNIDDWR